MVWKELGFVVENITVFVICGSYSCIFLSCECGGKMLIITLSYLLEIYSASVENGMYNYVVSGLCIVCHRFLQ